MANDFAIESYYDDNPAITQNSNGRCRPGIQLAGKDNFKLPLSPFCLAVGSNSVRASMASQLKAEFITAICHPSATVSSSSQIGEGSVVFANSTIQLNCQLGEHVIVNTAATIDHECQIGNFAHVSPNATLCGNIKIGEGSHIGAGATIIEGIKVGRWATVGAGAVVIRDVEDYATVVGCPARILYYSRPDSVGTEQETKNDSNELSYLSTVVNKLRSSVGKPPLRQLSLTQNLQQDLELDSLDLAEMTVLIESKFGVDVFDEGIATTVQDVIFRIKNK